MSSRRESADPGAVPAQGLPTLTHVSDITDLEQARSLLANYGLRLRPLGDSDTFHLQARQVSSGLLAVVRSTYGSPVEISGGVAQSSDLCFGTVISGAVELCDVRGVIDLGPGSSVVWDEAHDIRTRRPGAAELLMIRLDRAAFHRLVLDLLGPVDPAAGFALASPATPADRARWRAVIGVVEQLVAVTDGRPAALLADALDQFVVSALLETHPHTYLAAAPPVRADTVATRAAAIAAEYLRAHHDQPVRMAELASRLHLTPRALQAGFQRRYQMSMRDYLRTLRVQSAHQELLDDPTASVTELAYRWGFSSGPRFAAAYRAHFGVTPALAAAQRRAQPSRVGDVPKVSGAVRIA
ncbi:MAG: AraC family transcriptional regulator [Phycicoccus sp.]|nr:AraC family transcriptional regulator [Phycicoccus sp.]